MIFISDRYTDYIFEDSFFSHQNMQTQRSQSSLNSNETNNSATNVSDEQLRTLWCGNISDKVDEEVLYELFLNAGPLVKVFIPKDRETKKQKNFAFITFEDVESVKYAYDLLNGTELYRQSIRLQNKETGLGIIKTYSFKEMPMPRNSVFITCRWSFW